MHSIKDENHLLIDDMYMLCIVGFPFLLLLTSYAYLVCLMKKFHYFEMKKVWFNMLTFLLFEVVINVFEVILIHNDFKPMGYDV